jgi:hypothetical protein
VTRANHNATPPFRRICAELRDLTGVGGDVMERSKNPMGLLRESLPGLNVEAGGSVVANRTGFHVCNKSRIALKTGVAMQRMSVKCRILLKI